MSPNRRSARIPIFRMAQLAEQLTLNALGACPPNSVGVCRHPATSVSSRTSGHVLSVHVRRRPRASRGNRPHFCPPSPQRRRWCEPLASGPKVVGFLVGPEAELELSTP